jgi:SHS2 domain-containing protein
MHGLKDGYRFVEGHTRADVAFEASGRTLDELLANASRAVGRVMCQNPEAIRRIVRREVMVSGADPERLLHAALQEILFYKDAENLIFGQFSFESRKDEGAYSASMVMEGEEIDVSRHHMIVDIKAISWHKFKVGQDSDGSWNALVIVDV